MKKVVIGIIILLIGISVCIFMNMPEEINDSEKFSSEYTSVGKDNIFVYKNISDIIKILEKGTGIVFLGFPECPWCQAYAPLLNEAAKELGITKIYYCNIKNDRANNTSNYQKIVELLSGNLLYNDEGNERIYVPDITIVKNGKIVGHDNETSVVTEDDGTPDSYWTMEKKITLKTTLKEYIINIKDTSCHEVCDK